MIVTAKHGYLPYTNVTEEEAHKYHRTLQLAIALRVPLIEGNILTIYERLAKNRASGFVTKDKACKYMKQYIYKYIFHKHRYNMCI